MPNKQSYWDGRISSVDGVTATSVIDYPERINRDTKEKFANIVLRTLDEHGVDLANSTVLSAGCGTGVVSENLAEHTDSLVGFDFSQEAINRLQSRETAGDYYQSALPDVVDIDAPYDIVTAFSVLYHIIDDDDWKKSIASLAEVTADGGHLLLRANWLDEPIGSQSPDSHFYDRAAEDYKAEFAKHDLEILAIVDLPLKPKFISPLPDLPGASVIQRLLAPLIVLKDLYTQHENKLIVLKKPD